MSDYKTIKSVSTSEHTVQRSRFIARAIPISSECNALAELEKIRKEFWDAKHHCFAYRIGNENPVSRCSDDGEPSGTAGMPILEVLSRNELTNIILIVVRYFGGVLLGTGGLSRAYGKAAVDAVSNAEIVRYTECSVFTFSVPYSLWNRMEVFIRSKSELLNIEYRDNVLLHADVPDSDADSFCAFVTDISGGKLNPVLFERTFLSLPENLI